MNIIDLPQGSQEWLEYRRTAVTATDFAVVAANAGLCKNLFYRKIDKLIEENQNGHQIPDNRYFRAGRELEPVILNQLHFIDVVRGEVIVYEDNPRIMASLDARDTILDCVIEIKTTTKATTKLNEQIDYYKFQVAHQLYTAGLDWGYIVFGYYRWNEWDQPILYDTCQVEITVDSVISKNDWLELCNEFLERLK